MLWLAFAAILATPVLLGILPGSDPKAAGRLIIRCVLAGLILGFLASLSLAVASPDGPLRSGLVLPPAWGTAVGFSIGVLGIALRRAFAKWRPRDRDLRSTIAEADKG